MGGIQRFCYRVVKDAAARQAPVATRASYKRVVTEVRSVARRALELAESHSAARFVRPVVVEWKRV